MKRGQVAEILFTLMMMVTVTVSGIVLYSLYAPTFAFKNQTKNVTNVTKNNVSNVCKHSQSCKLQKEENEMMDYFLFVTEKEFESYREK